MGTPIVIRLTLEDGRLAADDIGRSRSFIAAGHVAKGTSALSCLAEAVRTARAQFPTGYTVEFNASVSRDAEHLTSVVSRWMGEDPDSLPASQEDARRIYMLTSIQIGKPS